MTLKTMKLSKKGVRMMHIIYGLAPGIIPKSARGIPIGIETDPWNLTRLRPA
jgi:hypothetical protein